jgi:hypothetical protein
MNKKTKKPGKKKQQTKPSKAERFRLAQERFNVQRILGVRTELDAEGNEIEIFTVG